jgi:hypothetical protein
MAQRCPLSAEQRHRSELLLLAFGHGRAHAAEAMRACAWGTHVRRLARRVDVRKPWRNDQPGTLIQGARVGNLSASGPAAAVPDATVFVLMEEAPENAASDLQMQRDHPFLAWDRPKCYLDLGANRFKNWNSPLNVFGCALFSFSIKDAYFLSDSKLYIM